MNEEIMKELEELEELAKPLKEFLEKNFNPYCYVCVTMDDVKMLQVTCGIPFEKQALTNYFLVTNDDIINCFRN